VNNIDANFCEYESFNWELKHFVRFALHLKLFLYSKDNFCKNLIILIGFAIFQYVSTPGFGIFLQHCG